MKRRSFLKTGAAVAGAGLVTGLPSLVMAKTSLKFDSYVSDKAGPSWIDDWFFSELEKRTNGEVAVKRYWSGSLNKVGAHLGAVRDGTSETTLISPGYYQAELPVTRGLEWYYRMTRADALQQVCRDVYDNFEPLRQEWEGRHRSKVLYWTNWNYAPMILREPIDSIDGLKGKRIRGYGVATDVIESLGGTAMPIAAPEVYQALERGVLDGVYGFDFVTAIAYKLHEIAPNFYDIGDGPHAPAATIMNIQVWNGMPDDVKKVAEGIVDDLYGGKFSEIYQGVLKNSVVKALKEGVTIRTISDADKARAKALVQPGQVNKWLEGPAKQAGIDGAAMQVEVEKAIAKYDPKGTLKTPFEISQSA